MGCGDAKIARHFESKSGLSVFSYDLIKTNEFVTCCDIANVKCPNESFDFVIFCLSLMGTNYFDFLKEANRMLKLRYCLLF